MTRQLTNEKGGIPSCNDIAAIVEEVQRLRRPRLGEVSAKSVHM
jgi:hypothetical protein